MRYRPFGRSGNAVSAVTLTLDDATIALGPNRARDLIFAALEAGVNTFHLASADTVLAEMVGRALAPVDRSLFFIVLRLGQHRGRGGVRRDFSGEALTGSIDQVLNASGLDYIDLALLDEPGEEELPGSSLAALKAIRSTGRARLLGVAGEGEVMDTYVSTNAFDVLATPFHVNSSWATRNRIRAAAEHDMAVMAYGTYPDYLSTPKKAETLGRKKSLLGWLTGGGDKGPLKAAGTFAFLHRTQGWSAEEICLAYALTEPTLATVLVEAADADQLAALTSVPERDLPPGLPAQIEMARVSTAGLAESA